MLSFERLDHVLTVLDTGCEDQHRFANRCMLDRFPTGRFYQLWFVHQGFEQPSHELAATHLHIAGVDFVTTGFGDQRRQVTLHDQFPDTDLVTHMIQKMIRRADQAGLQAKGRRRESDDSQVRTDNPGIREELPVHSLAFNRNHVRFVNENQIDRSQFAGTLVDRLNPGHDDRRFGFPFLQSGRVNAKLHLGTYVTQFLRRLRQQFFDVRKDQDASLPLFDGIPTDRGHHGRLTRACWQHHARIVIPCSQVFINGGNRLLLIRTQRDHRQNPRSRVFLLITVEIARIISVV